jgi:FkbM family methyltransferase
MPGRRLAAAVRYAAILARLGPTLAARAKVFATVLYLSARSRLRRPPGPRIRLRFRVDEGTICVAVDQISDLHAVDEVLLRDQYALPSDLRPKTIVDLGSHIGISVAFFRVRYPEARIFAFEPNPASFGKLEENVGKLPGVTIRRLALSSSSGPTVMHAGANPLLTSSKADAGEAFEVEAATLDEQASELEIDRIDLLKIDVEGAELAVLSSFEGLDRVGVIVGELHPALIGAPVARFMSLLDGFAVETEPAGADLQFLAVRADA